MTLLKRLLQSFGAYVSSEEEIETANDITLIHNVNPIINDRFLLCLLALGGFTNVRLDKGTGEYTLNYHPVRRHIKTANGVKVSKIKIQAGNLTSIIRYLGLKELYQDQLPLFLDAIHLNTDMYSSGQSTLIERLEILLSIIHLQVLQYDDSRHRYLALGNLYNHRRGKRFRFEGATIFKLFKVMEKHLT